MNASRPFMVCLTIAAVAVWSQLAAAQSSTKAYAEAANLRKVNTPVSNIGGYTGNQLAGIYRSSIGVGYSGDSFRALSAQSANFNLADIGQSTVAQGQIGNRSRIATFGGGTSSSAKPFTTASSRPTVSPYLSLFRESLDDSVLPNYNTIVQPRLQQQAFNEGLQRQQQVLERRLQQISAQPAFHPQGSRTQFPTGHQTVFNFTSHYYPAQLRRR